MLAEIVLPYGKETVTVREIPELFATAIHPEIPSDKPRQVTELRKFPLTEAKKNQWCGLGTRAFSVSLTDEDFAELGRGCWKKLPALKLPINEADWQIYKKALQKKSPPDWELREIFENPYTEQTVSWHLTVDDYKKTIAQAVLHGQLIPRSPHTFLPMPDAMGESLLDCFVTVADLTEYAAQIDIGVRIADSNDERNTSDAPNLVNASSDVPVFTSSARPLCVDPALLEMDANARIRVINNIGECSGTGSYSAGEYRTEIEACIKRQAEGFFTVDEAAQVLADSQPGVDVKKMINRMRLANTDGKLHIRDSGDRLPLQSYQPNRDFMSLVKVSDIDAWLDGLGVGYRFPQDASADKHTNEAGEKSEITQDTEKQLGVPRADILKADWPLHTKFNNESFDSALSDIPRWLESALVKRGKAGKNSSTWNPALLADSLLTKNYVTKSAVDRHLKTNFPDWLIEWEKINELR